MKSQNKHRIDEVLKNEGGSSSYQEQYKEIVQIAIDCWIDDFWNGRIKLDTVDDLKKLIEIDLELQRRDFSKRTQS